MINDSLIWQVKKITFSSTELLEKLERKEIYLPFLDKMHSETRKREWLTVRLLLKEILKEEKEILYTTEGKPYFKDQSFSLSISHSKDYVAVILGKKQNVSIDIEFISNRALHIREKFLNDKERKNVAGKMESIKTLLHWSAKETLFKILNKSEVDFKQNLHIDFFIPAINEINTFKALETKTGLNQSFDIYYLIKDCYLLTFTTENNNPPIHKKNREK